MKTRLIMLTLLLASAQLVIGEKKPSDATDAVSNYTAYTVNALKQHFPNVSLLTQDKKAVHFYDDMIKNKIVIIQFMYANCDGLCPMTTPNLAKVQKELEKRAPHKVSMISISVDPVHDTPQVLKEYADGFRVQPGWQFLTGEKSDIDLIRRKLGVYDPDAQKIAHLNVLTIGNEQTGQWLAMEALAKPEDIVETVLRLAGSKI
jgi:protein SCO1/2